MEIVINNRIKLKEIPHNLKEFLINELRFPNPKYDAATKQGYSTYSINRYIFNYDIYPDNSMYIPRGYRTNLFYIMAQMGITAKIIDTRTKFNEYINIDSKEISYRQYQSKAVSNIIKYDEGMFVSPAGSGKTVVGLSLIPLFGQPTLWLTHTKPLLTQVIERVDRFLPSLNKEDVGIIGSGKWKIGNVITVAMVQTLSRRQHELYKIKDRFGMVILDEAHHCPAYTFNKVISAFNPFYLYGMTATDYRRDGLERMMFQTIGECRARVSVEEVKEHGSVMIPKVRYRTFHAQKAIMVNGANILDGNDIQTILKRYILGNKKRNEFIVSDVIAEAVQGNFCLVISDRRQHCEELHELISASWEKAGIATGKYSKKYVEEQVKRLEGNEITVLTCTASLLGEGFDVAFLNRAFVCMPFRAEAKAEQIMGRIQRTAEGKNDAILYDYVDANCSLLFSQFYSKNSKCRYNVYEKLGADIEPY